MNKVTVAAHPETGNVITPSTKNVEYGTIRVDSVEVTFNNGLLNKSKRSAFIRGKQDELAELNLVEGSKMAGKIVKMEQYTPFYDGQNTKINPTTGEVVLTEGRETYIQFVFTEDQTETDRFIHSGAPVEETVEATAEAAAEELV
jgi:hypothetical protein